MLNITAENISSVISDHLIQYFIEPSLTNAKFDQTYKVNDAIRTLIRQNLKMTYTKSAGKNTSNPDSNVALEHFLEILNRLLDKHAPYVMSKSRSSFTSKPWITAAIANSFKNKNKI